MPDSEKISSVTGGSASSDEGREFRIQRIAPSDEPVLTSLFSLSYQVHEPQLRQTLSAMTRKMLRERFPAGKTDIREATFGGGLNVAVDVSDQFGAEFYLGHINEADDVEAVISSLPSRAGVVDVGTNFGVYALFAALTVEDARVVAFEPVPNAFELLERNCAQNEFADRVVCVRKAVADYDGTAEFFVASDSSFSGLRDTGRSPAQNRMDVDVTTLDSSPEAAALETVDFLKIDVEGFEAAVLKGAKRVVANSPDIVIMLEYSKKNLTEDMDAGFRRELGELIKAGFELHWKNSAGELKASKKRVQLEPTFSGNLFLWRPESAFGARLEARLIERSLARNEAQSIAPAAEFLLSNIRKLNDFAFCFERLAETLGVDSAEEPDKLIDAVSTLIKEERKAAQSAQRNAELSALRERERQTVIQRSETLRAELRAELKSRSERDNARIEALKDANRTLDEKAKQRRDAIAKLNAELDRLKAVEHLVNDQRSALQSSLTAHRTKLEEKTELVARLRSDNEALVASVGRLKDEAHSLSAQLSEAQSRNRVEAREMAQRIARFRTEAARAQIAHEALARRFAALKFMFPRQARLGEGDV